MKAELINNYWVVVTNRWDADIYTQEQAEKYADTLFNCDNCINCSYCSNCSSCINCIDCSNCINCRNCSYCSNCSYCINCRNCSYCSNCSYCINCRDCSNCIDCSSCHNCSNCHNCHSCSFCLDCSDFKTNPERIISPLLGSRNSQTTYYWNDVHEEVICGCFKGTMKEFESKVKETHGDNQHAQDYFNWIERVKLYKEVTNEQ